MLRGVEPEDLVKYGLIPEFVGRLPVVATLEELGEAALIQILTEPKNALIKQYQKMFTMEGGVDLYFASRLSRRSPARRLHARLGREDLRSILENALLDTMFDLPSLEKTSPKS